MKKLDPNSDGRLRQTLERNAMNSLDVYTLKHLLRSCLRFFSREESFGRYPHRGQRYQYKSPHANLMERNEQENASTFKEQRSKQSGSNVDDVKKKTRRCYHCGNRGHYSNECRKKKAGKEKITREKYNELIESDKKAAMLGENLKNLGNPENSSKSYWPREFGKSSSENARSKFEKSKASRVHFNNHDDFSTGNIESSNENEMNYVDARDQTNIGTTNTSTARQPAAHQVRLFHEQPDNPYDTYDPNSNSPVNVKTNIATAVSGDHVTTTAHAPGANIATAFSNDQVIARRTQIERPSTIRLCVDSGCTHHSVSKPIAKSKTSNTYSNIRVADGRHIEIKSVS